MPTTVPDTGARVLHLPSGAIGRVLRVWSTTVRGRLHGYYVQLDGGENITVELDSRPFEILSEREHALAVHLRRVLAPALASARLALREAQDAGTLSPARAEMLLDAIAITKEADGAGGRR